MWIGFLRECEDTLMKVLIVYDSVFGNTEKIAQAIGSGLGSQVDVKLFRVTDIKVEQVAGLDIFIAGSPTRGFRPTPTLRDFLKSIPRNGLKGVRVAAFDTRIAVEDVDNPILPTFVKVFGYAAKPIADQLQKKGGELCVPAEGFFVKDTEGPLKEGELERAAEWPKRILGKL